MSVISNFFVGNSNDASTIMSVSTSALSDFTSETSIESKVVNTTATETVSESCVMTALSISDLSVKENPFCHVATCYVSFAKYAAMCAKAEEAGVELDVKFTANGMIIGANFETDDEDKIRCVIQESSFILYNRVLEQEFDAIRENSLDNLCDHHKKNICLSADKIEAYIATAYNADVAVISRETANSDGKFDVAMSSSDSSADQRLTITTSEQHVLDPIQEYAARLGIADFDDDDEYSEFGEEVQSERIYTSCENNQHDLNDDDDICSIAESQA